MEREGEENSFVFLFIFLTLGFKWMDAWGIYTPQVTITLSLLHNINKFSYAFTP